MIFPCLKSTRNWFNLAERAFWSDFWCSVVMDSTLIRGGSLQVDDRSPCHSGQRMQEPNRYREIERDESFVLSVQWSDRLMTREVCACLGSCSAKSRLVSPRPRTSSRACSICYAAKERSIRHFSMNWKKDSISPMWELRPRP